MEQFGNKHESDIFKLLSIFFIGNSVTYMYIV